LGKALTPPGTGTKPSLHEGKTDSSKKRKGLESVSN